MLRRLFGLVVLLVIVGAAVYLWRGRPAGDLAPGPSARGFGDEARALGAEARDKLGVVGHKIEDAALAGAVKTALSLNRTLRPHAIGVSSQAGVVTLRGRVPVEGLRSRAEAVAAEVPDVVRVLNEIQVLPSGAPAREEVGSPGESVDGHPGAATVAERAAAAQRALRSNANVARFELEVRQEGERLVLRGHVGTLAEKDLAGMLAREGAGAPLDNLVEVSSGAR
jgi:osmotically-inducible protein OsmY